MGLDGGKSWRLAGRQVLRRLGRALLVAWLSAGAVTAIAGIDIDKLSFRHGIAFFHELKYPSDFTHFDYLYPNAPKGGALVLSTASAFNNLAPLVEGAIGVPTRFGFSSDTLLIRAGDEISAFYGRLADGIAVTDDRLAIVFRIHPDARWRDGVPITSDDVVFTLDALRQQIQSGMYFDFIRDVEPLDDRHVAVHLHTPLTLNNVIMMQFTAILPAHYWRERDPTRVTLEPPVSSGPYEIADIKQSRHVTWKRDPDYWGSDIPVNRGRYNFDTVRYDVYRDATVTREAFRKGLIDIFTEPDVRYWHRSYDIPALDKGWIRKIHRKFGIEVGVRSAIALNVRRDKFQDRRVRRALTLAMDFEWQNRTLHYGYRKRAHSYWPDTMLAATDLPSGDELALLEPHRADLPPELFARPFRFQEVATPQARRETLLQARQLLREAGWRVEGGALRNTAGNAFELVFLSQNPEDARTLLPYLEALKQLGIEGSVQLVDSTRYINLVRGFQFDAVLMNRDILMPPVIELKATYHSEAATVPLTRNLAGIADPVLDSLVMQANLATTLDQMVAACRAIDRVLLWQYYQIPLYAVGPRRTVHWDKFGIPAFEPDYWPAFPDGWWYDREKAARIAVND